MTTIRRREKKKLVLEEKEVERIEEVQEIQEIQEIKEKQMEIKKLEQSAEVKVTPRRQSRIITHTRMVNNNDETYFERYAGYANGIKHGAYGRYKVEKGVVSKNFYLFGDYLDGKAEGNFFDLSVENTGFTNAYKNDVLVTFTTRNMKGDVWESTVLPGAIDNKQLVIYDSLYEKPYTIIKQVATDSKKKLKTITEYENGRESSRKVEVLKD